MEGINNPYSNLFMRDGHIEAGTSNDSPNAIYPPQQLASSPDNPNLNLLAVPPSIQGLIDRRSRFTGLPSLGGTPEHGSISNGHPLYECAFWFLSCTYISGNEEEWMNHCLSHFRGQEPPTSVQCPLCEFHGTWGDGQTAW